MNIQMQAEDFFNAYLVLKENEEALMERLQNHPGKPLVGAKELGTRTTMGVEIVCLAFSVELFIKSLHYVVTGKIPCGHDILKLFEKLPEEIKQEIFTHDLICQNPFFTRGNIFSTKRFKSDFTAYDGFLDQIKAISDGFTKWRYSYESAALRYDTSFAMAFIESIKTTTAGVRV